MEVKDDEKFTGCAWRQVWDRGQGLVDYRLVGGGSLCQDLSGIQTGGAQLAGSKSKRDASLDVIILWWLALGEPLSWRKGLRARQGHRWIGEEFEIRKARTADAVQKNFIGNSMSSSASLSR